VVLAMNRILKIYILLIAVALLSPSCGVKYSLSGASIPPGMKTVSVQFFENGAPLVVPYLSQQFTDALKDRIRSQSSLTIVRADANANFEGRITDYSIRPTAIQGNERAGLDRITISVNVKYTNTLKPEQGFDQTFTREKEFSIATRTIQSQEQELIRDLNTQLTEDIFNRAFANW
jgi:hypothetical protein